MNIQRRRAGLIPILLMALPGLALAQQADPQMQQQMEQQEPEVTTYRDWEVACIETPQGEERCLMQQTLQIQDEQAQGAYLQTTLTRQGERYVIEVVLPLGVDLRPGILMQIDEDGEEIAAPYIVCFDQGCISGHELTQNQMTRLRGGRALTVGFWPIQGDQPMAFDVSLMGFTDASERL